MIQLMLIVSRYIKMEVLLLFLLAIPFFLLILLKFRINGELLPPGPPALLFIGHLHMLMFDNSLPHIFLYKLSQKYGSIMSLRFGLKPVLVVSSAKMAEEVLKTHDLDFCTRPTTRSSQRLSYNCADMAFSPYNAYWREIRKTCFVHLLNSNKVQQYRLIREDEVAHLIVKISKLSVDRQPVNLSEAIAYLTSTIICRVGFGKRCEEGTERGRFQGLFNEFQALLSSFHVSDYFPFLSWIDKLTGSVTRLEKCFQGLDTFYQQIIDEHLDSNRSKAEQEDIVDVLLEMWKRPHDFAIELTLDNIKAILMNVFLAGTDTTAAAIVWVMVVLMKNPKCMKKVQDEVRNLSGKKEFINEDDVKSLIYLKAVIKETLRLNPITPLLLPRESIRKCRIDGYKIPAKALVHVNVWAIGRDPEVWERPEEFYPNRFINSSVDFKGLDFQFIPFGAGRRICPGLHLGVAIVELTLANLLYHFDWEMPVGMNEEDLDFDALPGITIRMKNALCLLANKIN